MADPVITTTNKADTDNLYDWATVVITKSNGVEVERVTTYDAGTKATSGLVITQTTTDGFVSKIVTEDAGDKNPWSTITSEFVPGSKTLASKTTTYDNGTTNTETYVGGVLSQTVRTGSSDQLFTSITTTYDLVDGGHTVATTQANGQTTTDVFDAAGELVSRTQTDGASDSADWSSVVTTYTTTEGVETIERAYTYDNGVTRAETLVGGTLTTVVQTDSSTASWSTITETFGADGKLVTRAKVEDDGDTIVETYAAGVLTEVTRTDVSDAAAWQSMTRTYGADGTLLTEEQLKDDGMTVDKTFGQRDVTTTNASGVSTTKTINFATQVVTTDTDTVHETSAHLGLKSWESITSNYGADGLITSSTTVMDDTDTVVRTYADGVLSKVVTTDVNNSGINQTVTTTHGADGKMVAKEVLRHDDVTATFDYDPAGKVTHSLTVDTTDLDSPATTSATDKFDGEYAWTSVDKTFEAGKMVSQTVVYDDDRSVTSVYDDTAIGDVIMTVTQTQTGAVLSGEFWTDKVTTYVAGDVTTPRFVESSVTTTNLGRVTVIENGTDGVRDSMLVTDEGAGTTGAFNWDSIATHYNASGDMVSRLQVQDSGDQALRLYDDAGKLTDVVLYDGDNSNNWEFRVTSYDAAGVASTSLADASTLPTEYIDYFSAVPGLSVV